MCSGRLSTPGVPDWIGIRTEEHGTSRILPVNSWAIESGTMRRGGRRIREPFMRVGLDWIW